MESNNKIISIKRIKLSIMKRFLREIQNRKMIEIWSIIPTGLKLCSPTLSTLHFKLRCYDNALWQQPILKSKLATLLGSVPANHYFTCTTVSADSRKLHNVFAVEVMKPYHYRQSIVHYIRVTCDHPFP